MTYEEFAAAVARELDIEEGPPASATLVEDLGLDSLGCFNLVLFIDELSGQAATPDDEVPYPLIATMGDAYRYLEEMQRAGG